MEGFWIQLLAILTLLTQTCSASDTPELIRAVGWGVTFCSPKTATEGSASDTTEIRAVGGSVTFQSNHTDTEGNGALWSFGNIPIVTVPFKDPSQPFFYQDKFKTRFNVSERGRALSISQLRMEDVGTYSVAIAGKISTFILLVYKELTEPKVTCESLNCSDGRCNISLRCSVPGTSFGNVSYTWRVRDWQWERQSLEITVNKSSQDQSELLTCTARNAVSSRNVTVTTSDGLCSENSTHTLDPDTLSHSGDRVKFGIIGITVVVVILLVLLVLFCKSQGWRKFHLSQSKPPNTATTGEFTTVYAEVGPSQQRIPNGIKAKPAAGESSSTIYSLVKRPELLESATVTGLELV